MRAPVDRARLLAFLTELSHAATEPTRLYLAGGASQLLRGLRESTVDVDLTLEPEGDALLRSMVGLKETLNLNVEIVSPAHFVPALPGWRDRCQFVMQIGRLAVHHFDPYTQALSKIERGPRRGSIRSVSISGDRPEEPLRSRGWSGRRRQGLR